MRVASRHVVPLLAAVLALNSADTATIGSTATRLQQDLHLSYTELGLVVSVSSAVGAVAALPFGILADRVARIRTLAVAVVLWGIGAALTGAAWSLASLLAARVASGVVLAAAGPLSASLVGDWFPAAERGTIYGRLLTGELVGTGVGFALTGNLAGLLSWRAAFFALAPVSFALAVVIARLPEPERCATHDSGDEAERAGSVNAAVHAVGAAHIAPDKELARKQRRAVGSVAYAALVVVLVRTNLVLVIGSALTYFFMSGAQTFGVELFQERFGLSHEVATTVLPVLGAGAIAGVLAGGHLADTLLRRGRVTARVDVAATAGLLAGVIFVPALLIHAFVPAALAIAVAAVFLGAANPPADAARLDIMHPLLWGRAEAVRSLLRAGGQSAAPLLFGAVADHVFGGGEAALAGTFLVMLIPMELGGFVYLLARWTYPRDVATAAYAAGALGDPTGPSAPADRGPGRAGPVIVAASEEA